MSFLHAANRILAIFSLLILKEARVKTVVYPLKLTVIISTSNISRCITKCPQFNFLFIHNNREIKHRVNAKREIQAFSKREMSE